MFFLLYDFRIVALKFKKNCYPIIVELLLILYFLTPELVAFVVTYWTSFSNMVLHSLLPNKPKKRPIGKKCF